MVLSSEMISGMARSFRQAKDTFSAQDAHGRRRTRIGEIVGSPQNGLVVAVPGENPHISGEFLLHNVSISATQSSGDKARVSTLSAREYGDRTWEDTNGEERTESDVITKRGQLVQVETVGVGLDERHTIVQVLPNALDQFDKRPVDEASAIFGNSCRLYPTPERKTPLLPSPPRFSLPHGGLRRERDNACSWNEKAQTRNP